MSGAEGVSFVFLFSSSSLGSGGKGGDMIGWVGLMKMTMTRMKHKIYIVATNDRNLKQRIRKVPGVPIMSVARGKYVIERLPESL